MRTFTKSFVAVLAMCLIGMASVQAQGTGFAPQNGFRQINFGLEFDGYGIPVYAGMDFGVGSFITIGPRILFETRGSSQAYNWGGNRLSLKSKSTVVVPSFRGDYHFSGHIDGMTNKLDLYGGLTLGLAIYKYKTESVDFDGEVITNTNSGSDAELWGQLGARYYFNQKWAAHIEFTTLYGGDGALGVSYRF